MRETIFSKRWWAAAATRAIRTLCQTAAGGLTTAIAEGVAFGAVDWKHVFGVALVSAVYSLLTSGAGLPEVPTVRDDE